MSNRNLFLEDFQSYGQKMINYHVEKFLPLFTPEDRKTTLLSLLKMKPNNYLSENLRSEINVVKIATGFKDNNNNTV